MTAHTAFAPSAIAMAGSEKKQHRRAIMLVCAIVIGVFIALALYGASYYGLSQVDRPFSPKHHMLKPSGFVGINMGILGVLMLCAIFLYPLRKHWAWLQKRGNSKHWLDYHVVLGVAAPVCIAFHSSFKFRGLAGIAFWVMVAVAVSGLIGRYFYSQIPRRVAAAELSVKVFQEVLAHQKLIPQHDLQRLLRLPSADKVPRWPLPVALAYMVTSDLARPFRVARIRARAMGFGQKVFSFGGFLPSKNTQLEWLIGVARDQALLSRRIVFLSRAERVFRLWHVIHKPFSYAFAVLAVLHIGVAMSLGFGGILRNLFTWL